MQIFVYLVMKLTESTRLGAEKMARRVLWCGCTYLEPEVWSSKTVTKVRWFLKIDNHRNLFISVADPDRFPRFPETCQIFKGKKTLFPSCFEETSRKFVGKFIVFYVQGLLSQSSTRFCTSSIRVFYVQGLLSTTIDVQPYPVWYVQPYMVSKKKRN